MGKWISKLFGESSSGGKSGGKAGPGYINLEDHFRRLLEIEEALGEIGAAFSSASNLVSSTPKGDNTLQQICEMVNRLRVPGFFAYHLAQEGLALLSVIAASAALAKENVGVSEKINSIGSHVDEAEPLFRQTIYEMEPYKSMNAKEAVETIAARMAGRKGG